MSVVEGTITGRDIVICLALNLVNLDQIHFCVKGGLSLKIKNINIHLYFIATEYLVIFNG